MGGAEKPLLKKNLHTKIK